MRAEEDVTGLLIASTRGDVSARDALWSAVYDELRRVAHRELRHERGDHTLGTTALVHEAYLKLVRLDRVEWQSRAHFYAIAAQAMRRILINHATAKRTQKRGGGVSPATLDDASDEAVAMADERADELLALDEALGRLEALDARQARVVECRFFGGMSVEETAAALGISPATVKRDWVAARAWLNREVGAELDR
jgi:RNA polymerase sigma factor (TIGR02999 family)